MSKVRDKNIILGSNEKIIFPNSQIYEDSTAGLVITGVSTIDAAKIKGITVDDSNIADQASLVYDQASNTLVYVV